MPRRAMRLNGAPAELSCDGCGGTVMGYFPERLEAGPKHRCRAHDGKPSTFTRREPRTARDVRGWRRWWRD